MLTTKQILLFSIALLLTILTYWGGLAEAALRWNIQEEYSHGFLIPLVSLYILWEKKPHIIAAMGRPLWSGIIVLLVAIIIFIVGEISALFLLIHYSFVLVLIALSMVTIGRATKYTLAPILLLLFAIPLPYVIEVLLTAKLQLLSSWIGVQFIRFFDIPVYLEGNVIDLGIYQLQVVEACSGLRYLFPLMSLGFIIAYFYQTAFWKRSIVFLATIPVTILMNSFRIGMIAILVEHSGIAMAEGFLHDFEGWIIFMVCAAILLLLIWILEKLTNNNGSWAAIFGVPEVTERSRGINLFSANNDLNKPLLLLIGLLATTFVLVQSLDKRVEQTPDHIPFATFPMTLGKWQGKHDKLEKEIVDELGMTDYLLADYARSELEPAVNFYVAYYAAQRKGVSPHSPKVCIPGGGWEINSLERTTVNGHPTNRLIIKKGQQTQLVYYWFQGHGRIIANEYINKWYLFLDSIVKNRTDGALVRVVTSVTSNESIAAADSRIIDFIASTEPELTHYILD